MITVQLFYYFIESERDAVRDPLVLWLTGGPGCSAFSGLVYEIGPLTFDAESYNGSLPSFILNPYAWTKIANIIFLDLPVGTGFSYATTFQGYHSSDTKSTKDAYMFLQKWLLNHPKFINNRLYIAGDSYGGKLVPMVVLEITKRGNEAGLMPQMSIELTPCFEHNGYLLGNPGMNPQKDLNWRVPYAHLLGLISDKYYERAKSCCNGDYKNPNPNKAECQFALHLIKQCTSNICPSHILEPICKFRAPKLDGDKWDDLTYFEEDPIDILLPSAHQENPKCRFTDYVMSYVWMNNPSVREALQIRKGTKEQWKRCNESLAYDQDVASMFDHHQVLSAKGYQALVYSGDDDMMIPYIGTLQWIRNLNLTLDEDWRPWHALKYQFQEDLCYLTFATVKGAGHTASESKTKECFAMIVRWFSYYPL